MNTRSLVQHLIVAVSLVVGALPAAAQHAPDGGMGDHACPDHGHRAFDPARFAQHWQQRAQRLSQRLGLDGRQQQRLAAIVQTELQRFQQTVAPLPERTPERRAARRALMQDFDTRLGTILTPAQRAQWEELKQERRARFQQRGEGAF